MYSLRNNAQLSEARLGENFFNTYEQANRARFFRESRMNSFWTNATWMLAPSGATGNQFSADNFITMLGGFAPNAMPQGLRPRQTQLINPPGLRSWRDAGISPNDATRIQNAANKTGQRITVVGSRAKGTANPTSD
jgi:hypothetical protein